MEERVRKVSALFEIEGVPRAVEPVGGGHIHDTFLAHVESAGGERRYVHQRVNERVFPDADGLMRNLVRLTDHLRARLRARGVADLERRCLTLVPARQGGNTIRDDEGRLWRTFLFIDRAHPAPVGGGSAADAREAARAFGAFAAECADLSPSDFVETIPGFHDLPGRGEAFERSVADDAVGRVNSASDEIERAREGLATIAASLAAGGADALPLRVVHNDCKLDNVMLDDASGEALCVLDLDTTMAGTLLYDFGQVARTGACPAPEDERNLERVVLDRDRYEALARGYGDGVGALSEAEAENLWLGGPLMTLENAVRFLTDHLAGDTYFRIHRPGHNLERARVALRLLERMWEAGDDLRRPFSR